MYLNWQGVTAVVSKKPKWPNSVIYLFMYELAKISDDVLGRLYQERKYLTNVPWLYQLGKICLKVRNVQMSLFERENKMPVYIIK